MATHSAIRGRHGPDRADSPVAVRRALTAVVTAVVLGAASCRRATPPAGLVVVNPVGNRPTFFDFGTVPYGQPIEHVFRIRNDEAVPVTIKDLLPSCSCSSPRISYVAKDGSVVQGDGASRERVITLPSGAVADLVVKI